MSMTQETKPFSPIIMSGATLADKYAARAAEQWIDAFSTDLSVCSERFMSFLRSSSGVLAGNPKAQRKFVERAKEALGDACLACFISTGNRGKWSLAFDVISPDEGVSDIELSDYAPRTRTQCKRCAKPLPEGHFTYCSEVCYRAANLELKQRRAGHEADIREAASRVTGKKGKPIEKRDCAICRKPFSPPKATSRFCTPACYHESKRSRRRQMLMVCEPV